MTCPWCHSAVQQPAAGPRRVYCGDACRRAAEPEIRRLTRRIAVLDSELEGIHSDHAHRRAGWHPDDAADAERRHAERVSGNRAQHAAATERLHAIAPQRKGDRV